MSAERPEIFVLGGPNGAGKSSVGSVLLPGELQVSRFVNADHIARRLEGKKVRSPSFAAGRLMIRRLRRLRSRRLTFGFEATLSSLMFGSFLQEAKRDGYRVHLVYVSLSGPDLAVSRVALRVSEGGHGIAEAVVRRRFDRSLRNFLALYAPMAETWVLWDNSGRRLVEVARRTHGRVEILDARRWARVRERGTRDAR